jgi:nitrous oxide reductase
MNFEWLENDKAIIDTLVTSSTAQPDGSNVSNDILQYLLQTDNSNTAPLSFHQSPQEKIDNHVTEKAPPVVSTAASTFRSTVSVVQSKDNFVTFMPLNNPTKKSTAPKKTKFKEPIFVTESPQNAYKKKKKPSNNNASQSHSSGEDNSDDDMLLDEELGASTSSSKLKQMTSKERRQLRNKISARNFRVRRKGK